MIFNIDLDKNHYRVFIGLIAWMILTYMLPNKYVLLPPSEVNQTFVDQMIPLSSIWIWVYISYYFFIFFPYLFGENIKRRKLLLSTYTTSAGVSCLIFFAFPTSISRELYPLQVVSLSDQVLNIIRTVDASVNCIPSMHIALSLIATLTYWTEDKLKGSLASFWFLMISYSTMATKQHYFHDVITGAFLGLFFWVICFYSLKKTNHL